MCIHLSYADIMIKGYIRICKKSSSGVNNAMYCSSLRGCKLKMKILQNIPKLNERTLIYEKHKFAMFLEKESSQEKP